MKRTFEEVIKEVSERKLSNRASAETVEQLANAYLNDAEHKFTEVKKDGNTLAKTEVKPVKAFRDMIATVLTKAGLDSEDANKFMSDYQFKKAESNVLPDLANEFILGNLKSGKKYQLAAREDLVAQLELIAKPECVKENKNPQNGEAIVTKYEAFNVIKAVSTAPAWKKSRVE